MNSKQIGLFLLSVAVGIIIVFALTGCNTFKPTSIPGEPQECNDMYTLMDFSTRMTGPFSKENTSAATALTLTTLSYKDCLDARKQFKKDKRFEDCKIIIYGKEITPKKENYKKYSEFLECLKK